MQSKPNRSENQLITLKKRREFVAARSGARSNRRAFILQSRIAANGAHSAPRFGFTVTKKVGNAVVRNRIRRRLREAVRQYLASCAPDNGDYVLIGKAAALHEDFDILVSELRKALDHTRSVSANPRSIVAN